MSHVLCCVVVATSGGCCDGAGVVCFVFVLAAVTQCVENCSVWYRDVIVVYYCSV